MSSLSRLVRWLKSIVDSVATNWRLLLRPRANLTRISWRLSRPVRRRLSARRGYRFGRDIKFTGSIASAPSTPTNLEVYFDSHRNGPGIWKWRHYFAVYDRYFAKFVGQEVSILEVGIYSGGSLEMWQKYFGPRCHVHGVDIEEACKAYESGAVRISVGDQADPEFWARLLSDGFKIDIAIDDGGHRSDQQIATLEALLPRISPGGVYVCEDVHGVGNEFHDYVSGLARNLHTAARAGRDRSVLRPSELQRMVSAVHIHPFMVVIERSEYQVPQLVAPRHGTQWQPFYDAFPPEKPRADC